MRFFTTLVALASAALAASSVQAESATKNMSVSKLKFCPCPSLIFVFSGRQKLFCDSSIL